ncbi:MAG: hypothetical protein KatS3mg082_2727 [Nitrospiraceae bacterium]|nr:MAG: hypothetical protein KatS3mg082_2727 [Nitrospiraceae bacterium]GIW81330.1 MAG: hypothetical protein KatS3mg105_3137 [Gemmatales bacterium]
MWRFGTLIVLLALALPVAAGPDSKHGPPHEPLMPKRVVDDAGEFFRSAKSALDKLAGPVLQAIYLAGVRDGAVGATVALIVIYLFFVPRKT